MGFSVSWILVYSVTSQLGMHWCDRSLRWKGRNEEPIKKKVPVWPGELQRSTCHSLEPSEGVSSEGLPGSAWAVE